MLKSVEEPETVEDRPAGARPEPGGVAAAMRTVVQAVLMVAILAGSYLVMERMIAAAPERTTRPQPEISVPVQAMFASTGDQRPMVSLFGEVTAGRTVDIRPPASGEVVQVNPALSAGDRVEAGALLFAIDPFNAEIALAEARAGLAQTDATIAEIAARLTSERAQLDIARDQLALARNDLARAERLRSNGALTARQVEDRTLVVSQREQSVSQRVNNIAIEQARLDQQRAVRTRQRLGVRRAGRNLDDTTVRAPFAGVIRSSTVETGRIVAAGDVTVAMYDDTALDVRFTLTDAQYGRIATDTDPLIGRGVSLVWTVGHVDYAYTATVDRIGADIAADRGGIDIYARIAMSDAPVQLRPGAFVAVSVPDRLYADAVRLPETALHGTDTMYVVEQGRLARRTVEIVAFEGSDVIVGAGLVDGDQVLTTRLSNVEDGLRVTVAGAGAGQAAPPDPGSPVTGGRSPPETIAAAKRISGLTDDQWNALTGRERRSYLRQARETAGGRARGG